MPDRFGGPFQRRLYHSRLSPVETSVSCSFIEYLKRDGTVMTVNDVLTVLHNKYFKSMSACIQQLAWYITGAAKEAGSSIRIVCHNLRTVACCEGYDVLLSVQV